MISREHVSNENSWDEKCNTQRYSGTLNEERGEEDISLKKIGNLSKLLMATLNREDLDHDLNK
jgi:hypothetical protein